MLDLICHRYPGRRPSDYLELDEYQGFQVDFALAFKYSIEEEDIRLSYLDAILSSFNTLYKAVGVKKVPPYQKIPKVGQKIREEVAKAQLKRDNDDIPLLSDLMAVYGKT